MKKPQVKLKRQKPEPPSRITNETVAEHRERILAGGRRFKYPVQYSRHKLVLNAILISVVVIVAFVIVCWQQLYIAQNTNEFFYRITSVVPVPVASVDGSFVRYSDYLLYYNGSAYYLEQSAQATPNSKDGKAQFQHIKRESLTDAEADTYAARLARQMHISVSKDEVSDAITQNRASYGNISEQVYNASALSILGWTPAQYGHVMENKLLRQKVSYAVDTNATKTRDMVSELLSKEGSDDFGRIVTEANASAPVKVEIGTSGLVPRDNSDGGLSQVAAKLKVGQVSDAVKTTTGSGYYFVKLIAKTDTQVNYTYIRVPLKEFDDRFAKLQADKKINEFISVKDSAVAGSGSDTSNQ